MMRVSDLRALLQHAPGAFAERVGPIALIQRPPDPVLAQVAMQLGSARTVGMAHRSRLGEQLLAMLTGFEHLWVVELPVLTRSLTVVLGRRADCDVIIAEPSVSQRHATLRWDAVARRCFLQDLASSNGTYLNAGAIHDTEVEMVDGDTVALGDAQFVLFRAETLQAQLAASVPVRR